MEWLAERDKIIIDGIEDNKNVIPNKNAMEWLTKKGKDLNCYIGKVDRPVVITAHGVKRDVLERLQNIEIKLIDTTCEKIKKIYEVGKELQEKGYHVAIFGDKTHPEVQGVASRLQNPIFLANDIDIIDDNLPKRIGIICQTTSIQSHFEKTVNYISNKISDCKAVNTICYATTNRQNAVLDLSKKADIVIVIGGEHSSNTKKLKEIAEVNCETYHIQVPEQVKKYWFSKKKVIGITAGASTPPWIIKNIEDTIKNII